MSIIKNIFQVRAENTKRRLEAERNMAPAIYEEEMKRAHTSHLLHFILAIITGGFWIPIWILAEISNESLRKAAKNKLARFT